MTTQPNQSRMADTLTAILLFIAVFAIWQVYWQILETIKPVYPFDIIFFLIIPCTFIAICAAAVILRKSTFKREGFRKPATINTKKTITISIACIAIYIFMLLAPGITAVMSTGNITEGYSLTEYFLTPLRIAYRIVYGIAYAAIFSLAYEAIFRGHIFRNLTRHYGFFTSLYASSIMFCIARIGDQISIKNLLAMSTQSLVTFIFLNILTVFAAGLFLGYYFYKTGWSLLGPITFQIGILFFLWPDPLVASTSVWWIALTFQIIGYVVLILAIDSLIKEPAFVRKKYGLES